MKLKLLVTLLAGGLLLPGCGSIGETSSLNQPAGPTIAYQGFILGRVKLSPELAAGPVEIRDANGQLVYQLQSERLGWFWTRGQLPGDFVVLARRGADVYSSEVKHNWQGGTIYVTAGTTLANAYRLAHSGLSDAESSEKVRQFYHLPADFPMSWISTVPVDGFSTSAFFSGVQQAGSLQAYLQRLLPQMEAGAVAPKSLLEKTAGLIGSAITGCISDQVNTTVGAATSNMGLNFTTADALQQIQSALTQISEELASLQQEIDAFVAISRLAAILGPLRADAQLIQISTTAVNQAVVAFQQTHGEGKIPYQTPSTYSVASAVAALNTFQLNGSLNPIRQACSDTTSAGLYYNFCQAQAALANLESDTSWNSYSYRYNTLTRQQQSLFAAFSNSMAQGAFLTCEYANIQTNKAFTLATATNTSLAVAADIQAAAQQVPDLLPSDELVLDIPNGAMWYNSFCPIMEPDAAFDFADQMSIGPYDDFHLPTQSQMVNQLNGRVLHNTSPVFAYPGWPNADSSIFTAAFRAVGFDTTNYGAAVLDDGISSHQNNEGSWCALDGNARPSSTNHLLYFWNGTATSQDLNPATDTRQLYTAPFLVCRDYPGSIETNATPYQGEEVPLNNVPPPGTNTTTVSPLTQNYIYDSTYHQNPPTVSAEPASGGGQQLRLSHRYLTGAANFFGPARDVTGRALWTSSNPGAASVSNLPSDQLPGSPPYAFPGPIGWITWHPPLDGSPLPDVTFTGGLFGALDNAGSRSGRVSGNITLQAPANLSPSLKQVQVFPRNLFISLLPPSPTTLTSFNLIAYYVDGQVADVSTDPNTTWSVQDANGNTLNSSTTAGFGVIELTQKNQLYVNPDLATSALTVNVNYAGSWGSGTASAAMGLIHPNQVPDINKVLPSMLERSSITSSTSITITGSRLAVPGETPVVTFGGVPATFVRVTSASQLTVGVPPSSVAGAVPLVVTTSQGDSTFTGQPANFTYE